MWKAREWYGLTTGLHPAPASIELLRTFFPRIKADYVPSLTPTRKGESISSIHARADAAVRSIIAACDAEDVRTILLCTHAATNIALGRALTGDPQLEVHTGTASVGEYVRESRPAAAAGSSAEKSRWTCVRNGDCSFLTGGEERNWWYDGEIPLYDDASKNAAKF